MRAAFSSQHSGSSKRAPLISCLNHHCAGFPVGFAIVETEYLARILFNDFSVQFDSETAKLPP